MKLIFTLIGRIILITLVSQLKGCSKVENDSKGEESSEKVAANSPLEIPPEAKFKVHGFDALVGKWTTECLTPSTLSLTHVYTIEKERIAKTIEIFKDTSCDTKEIMYRLKYIYTNPVVSEGFNSEHGLPVDLKIQDIEHTFFTEDLVNCANKKAYSCLMLISIDGEAELGKPIKSIPGSDVRVDIPTDGRVGAPSKTGETREFHSTRYRETAGSMFYTHFGIYEGHLVAQRSSLGSGGHTGESPSKRTTQREAVLRKL